MPSDQLAVPAIAASAVLANFAEAVAAVAPSLSAANIKSWTQVFAKHLPAAEITTQRRAAAFLGQCAFESGGFRHLEESLSYTSARLCQVWPNRFPTLAVAQPFALSPEALANNVYAGRMGNGGTASGDGWHFRGRGLIQLTGRAGYERFAAFCGESLDAAATAAATPDGAVQSAAWFWNVNGLNSLADAWELAAIALRINGSLQAAAARCALCNTALKALAG